MYEPPEVERMDSKTGPVPVVVNFAAVVDNVVAGSSSNHLAYHCMRLTAQPQPTPKAP